MKAAMRHPVRPLLTLLHRLSAGLDLSDTGRQALILCGTLLLETKNGAKGQFLGITPRDGWSKTDAVTVFADQVYIHDWQAGISSSGTTVPSGTFCNRTIGLKIGGSCT